VASWQRHAGSPQLPRDLFGETCLAEAFGMLANACWNPSISIPAGMTSDGLPVGLQIVARRHRDDILLRLARIAELAMPWPYLPDMKSRGNGGA
jgi:Asp-tRNA(Asn)/Glu-tRNA(Gln) amidotransferase A subunit family amidase